MRILDTIVNAIARIVHPDKPREFFEHIVLPTDLTEEEVVDRLDEAAEENPSFENWRTSVVDLMKLAHPEDPDGASSIANRRRLATELGRPDYEGTDEENRWLHAQVFKAIQQRGIPLPELDNA